MPRQPSMPDPTRRMTPSLARSLDSMQVWRRAMRQRLAAFAKLLDENGLVDAAGRSALDALDRKLAADRLVVACVAEAEGPAIGKRNDAAAGGCGAFGR